MMISVLNHFWIDEEAASATEYAVLILMIVMVALVAIALLGGEVSKGFQKFTNEISAYNT